jgi:hypothetical protein
MPLLMWLPNAFVITAIAISIEGSVAVAQDPPIQLSQQECPATESLPHPCWALTAIAERVTIENVLLSGGDCVLTNSLALPMDLKYGEAVMIVDGLCTLGLVTVQTTGGQWEFAPPR